MRCAITRSSWIAAASGLRGGVVVRRVLGVAVEHRQMFKDYVRDAVLVNGRMVRGDVEGGRQGAAGLRTRAI